MELKVKALDVIEPKSVQEVEQQLVEGNKKEEDKIPHIDLSNINKKEPVVEQKEEVIEEVAPQEVVEVEDELDEQKVLSYIGKRYNKQINSFDDLVAERKETEELPEDVAAFLKYKKETGRGFEDFLNLRKDHDTMDPEQLVKEYLSATQEGLDAEDIDALMDDYRYDEDIDDESKIKKIKIERKKVINEAKKFFNTQKEKYKLPLESSSARISKEEEEEYNAYRQYLNQAKTIEEETNRKRQWFDQKTNELFDGEFKGFEFDVNNKKLTFTPGEAAELKKIQSTPANFIAKFLDDNGLIKDAKGYHRSLSIAMNPDKFAKFFYEQGLADAVDDVTRKIKNVNMGEQKSPEVSKSKDGVQVRAVNPDSGKGLKIRSIKRI
jgi:hypothetical protein